MAIYEEKTDQTLAIKEIPIYGSSRLGQYRPKTDTKKTALGQRIYEFSNHLGNVLVTLTDHKVPQTDGTYKAIVLSASDYYPFGMAMKERTFANSEYRYGFNGQEQSDELDENRNSYTAEFWQYDSKIARRWNVDPVVKHYESSYAAFANNPIWFVDVNGQDTLVVNTQMLENTGKTVIFKVTLSLIQNGVESTIELDIPEGGTGFYFMLPREYWKHGNVWYQEREEDMFSVRFEEYGKKINSIKITHPKGDSSRALAHFGKVSTDSKGCQIPTCRIDDVQNDKLIDNTIDKDSKIISFKSQEVLNTIRSLYDKYIPSSEGLDKWGRKISVHDKGYDFMIRTNSVARTQLSDVLKNIPKPEIKLDFDVKPKNPINPFRPKGN